MRVNSGADLEAGALGATTGYTGTTTSGPTATTATDSGAKWTANQWAGQWLQIGAVIGVVISNTETVLTIDRWANPKEIGAGVGGTPASGTYNILPGQAPAAWMCLSTNATEPKATDTVVAEELATTGLSRSLATWAHTAATTSYTLTKTFKSGDVTERTIRKLGILQAQREGRLMFEDLVPSPPTVLSGDELTCVDTISM